MKHVVPKIYNLNEYRPQVLLTGNGLVYDNDYSWKMLIGKISTNKDVKIDRDDIPYSIMATLKAPANDHDRHDKYTSVISNKKIMNFENLKRILKLNFDAVLTTNYTYEIEECMCNGFNDLSVETQQKKSFCTEKGKRNRRIINVFNSFEKENIRQNIWHVHGELSRHSSIILNIDEYARLTNDLVNYSKSLKNYYQDNYDNVHMKSWIDYFLMGDVYILGFTYDFTEFDLWWLLNRKIRENADCGKVIYYCPKNKHEAIQKVFEEFGNVRNGAVECRTLDVEVKHSQYDEFYKKAIEDIQKEIEYKQNMLNFR